jgi:hypothetical protein
MDFKIDATPALEEFGGPPEDSVEAGFIDLNLAGLTGNWLYDGEFFVLQFEAEAPEMNDASFAGALHKPGQLHGRALTKEQLTSDALASYGQVYFQQRGANVMHVEYLLEHHRGETVGHHNLPRRDAEIEDALRQWLLANEAEVVGTVRDRAGEMR